MVICDVIIYDVCNWV